MKKKEKPKFEKIAKYCEPKKEKAIRARQCLSCRVKFKPANKTNFICEKCSEKINAMGSIMEPHRVSEGELKNDS